MNILPSQRRNMSELISGFIGPLLEDRRGNEQKILEVCHVAKFLTHFENYVIDQVSEKPDFIICNGKGRIGLEHQIVIDPLSIEKEGFIKNIFSLVEAELQNDSTLSNFHVNCYLKPLVNFKLNQKATLVLDVMSSVRHFLATGEVIENLLIERFYRQPHSGKTLSPNLGGWSQKVINQQLLEFAIEKKERKIESYIRNCTEEQWLVLVIGSMEESSYVMDLRLDFKPETRFNKVFLLEDFKDVLYEIK